MPKKQNTGTNVINWEEQMAQQAKAVAKTERASVNRINFKSGVMTYMDNAIPDNTLDCIVVGFVKENVLYTERYKADVVVPPACFALAMPDEPLIPHEVVAEPFSDRCETCENYKWNTDPGGGRGKACKERRRLAIIPKPDSLDDIADSEMAIMSIPVMSVKNWANYVNMVAASTARPPWGVVTRVQLVPDAKSQFKVTFNLVDALDSEYLPFIHERIDVAHSALMTPYEMEPEDKKEEGDKKNTKY